MDQIGVNMGNNQDISQLHRFTTRKNIAKSFRGLLFDAHCKPTLNIRRAGN